MPFGGGGGGYEYSVIAGQTMVWVILYLIPINWNFNEPFSLNLIKLFQLSVCLFSVEWAYGPWPHPSYNTGEVSYAFHCQVDLALVDIYSAQSGTIACTITKGLFYSSARIEQMVYNTLYQDQLLGFVMLYYHDWVSSTKPKYTAHPLLHTQITWPVTSKLTL